MAAEDAPPPPKKSKVVLKRFYDYHESLFQKSDGSSEPSEDYSGKENIALLKPIDAKKAAHNKKMKSAAKGTKSIMGFFTPKKK